MNFGDIFGSISPAFGAATGQGLGGILRYLNLPFLLAHGIGGGEGGGAQSAPAQKSPLPVPGQAASALSGMGSGGNPLGAMGALMGGGNKQPAMQPFDPSFGMSPQPSGLGQILAQLLAR